MTFSTDAKTSRKLNTSKQFDAYRHTALSRFPDAKWGISEEPGN